MPCGAQLRLGQTGAARRHVEHLHDGRPLRASVRGVAAADCLGGNPALPVRRAGEHRERGLAGEQVSGLHGVARREDVGRRRAHLRVDHDAPARSDLEAGVTGKVHVGTRPGRHDEDVGLD